MKRLLMVSALAAAMTLPTGFALAADPEPTQAKPPAQKQVYGSQLMTQQERIEYRSKMRAAKTAEERKQIRNEHHEQMKARAKERGMALPDAPPASGMGAGGGGMGQGGGGGPGR